METPSGFFGSIKPARRYLFELSLSLIAYAFVLSVTLAIMIHYPTGRQTGAVG